MNRIDSGAFDGNPHLLAIMVTKRVDYVTEAAWGAHSQTLAICDKLGVDIANINLSNGIYTVTLKDNTLNGHEITQTGQGGTQHDTVDGDTFTLLSDAYGSGKWLIFEPSVEDVGYAYVLLDSEGILHMYAGMSKESLPEADGTQPLPSISEAAMISDVTVVARFKMPTHLPSATHWNDDVEFSDWSYLQNTENPVVKAVVVETPIHASSTANWFKNFRICTSFDLAKLDTTRVTNMSNMFSECRALETLDLSTFNTAFVTDMSGMFNTCYKLNDLDLTNFKTPRVISMSQMFNNCTDLKSLDLTGFSNASLTKINSMFSGASKLKTIYVGSEWMVKDYTGTPFSGNTAPLIGGRGTEFREGLGDASYACVDNDMGVAGYFTYIGEPLTRNVIDGVSITAEQDDDGNYILVLNGDTIPEAVRIISTKTGVSNESYIVEVTEDGRHYVAIADYLYTKDQSISIFKEEPVVFGVLKDDKTLEIRTGAVALKEGNASFTDENGNLVTCPQERIYSAPTDNVEGFGKSSGTPWNTATAAVKVVFIDSVKPVGSIASWFNGMTGCEEIDLTNVDFSAVTNMTYMFQNCSALTNIIWPEAIDTASLTNMDYMFNKCTSLAKYPLPENFNTTNVKSMQWTFGNCSSLENLVMPDSFDTSSVTTMQNMFNGCTALKSITWSANFKTGNVQRMDAMFSYCESLETLALPATFDTQNVTSMGTMFGFCYKLKNLSFDSGIFNTSKVSAMGGMFRSCYALTDEDFYKIFSHFTETTSLTNIGAIFNSCTGLKNFVWPEVLNTSKVTYMRETFQYASNLETVDLTNLDTTLTTNIQQFFNGCTNLTTIWVSSSWNTDIVTDDANTFSGCTNLVGGNGTVFNRDIVGKDYARIDGENGLPGYFTAKPHDNHGTTTYTDNADGTHTEYCGVYGEPIAKNEAHTYTDGVCKCGNAESTETVAAEPTCTCEIKCEELNAACEVCKTDITLCKIKDAA